MEFLKRHLSTIVLITIAAIWIGISLGTNDCPSCVVMSVAKNAFASEDSPESRDDRPTLEDASWSTVDMEGNRITGANLRGKVCVLVYWATWCGRCKKEIPSLIALRNEFSDTELEIIALSVDEAHKDLKAFAEERGINYRIARVTPSVIETFGHADAIPTTMIADQEGRIQFRHTGFADKEMLAERVRSLLAQQQAPNLARAQ